MIIFFRHSIQKVSVLGTLEQHVVSSASLPPSQVTESQSNTCSTVTVKQEELVVTSVLATTTHAGLIFKSETTNRTEPSIKNENVDINSQTVTFSSGGESSKIKQADTNLVYNVDIQDTITLNNNGSNSSVLQETNKATSSKKQVDTAHDFVDTNAILHSSSSTAEAYPSHNSAPENVNFSCSSISSLEDFDSKKFSLSYILSL